jgi:hypothetical protein
MRKISSAAGLMLGLVLMYGCHEANQTADDTDAGPDASTSTRDGNLSPQPDLGDNCILIRDDSGEWVAQCQEPDQMLPTDVASRPSLMVLINQPVDGAVFSEEQVISLSGSVVATDLELAYVAVEVSVSGGAESVIDFDRDNGGFTAALSSLAPGEHLITFTARAAPDLEASHSVTVRVDCGFTTDFNEPLDPQVWNVLGSAGLDSRGWLEMSNNQTSTSGGIFLTGRTIDPGSLQMSFRISTGASQCNEPDLPCVRSDGSSYEISDGFAVTFWNVNPQGVDDLWGALCRCGSGAITTESILDAQGLSEPPEGITIEFDSYPNSCPNNGFFDPVQAPHIEILQNGRFYQAPEGLTREERCMFTDFSDEEGQTWAAFPAFTDNFWHDVELTIEGGRVTVIIDGVVVLDAVLPDFRFKGGILAFSGGSGAVAAYQRFDDLSIQSGCP